MEDKNKDWEEHLVHRAGEDIKKKRKMKLEHKVAIWVGVLGAAATIVSALFTIYLPARTAGFVVDEISSDIQVHDMVQTDPVDESPQYGLKLTGFSVENPVEAAMYLNGPTQYELEMMSADMDCLEKTFTQSAANMLYFDNSEGRSLQIMQGQVSIFHLEEIIIPHLYLHAIVADNKLYVYAVNDGWGPSFEDSINLHLIDSGGDIQDFGMLAVDNNSILYIPALDGGEILLVAEIALDTANFIDYYYELSYTNEQLQNQDLQYMLGLLYLSEDGIALDIGAGAPEPDIHMRAIVDVASGETSVPLSIWGNAKLEPGSTLVAVEVAVDKSCKMEYTIDFNVSGMPISTPTASVSIETKIFKFAGEPFLLLPELLMEHGVTSYHYGDGIPEIENNVYEYYEDIDYWRNSTQD